MAGQGLPVRHWSNHRGADGLFSHSEKIVSSAAPAVQATLRGNHSQKNRAIAKKKPWTKGLYEGVIAADLIAKQRLDQRNRIALIVLDSTLEIAFKEYLVNESGVVYNDQKLLSLFGNRTSVQNEVKICVTLKPGTWKKIDHYYWLRCKLVHERATVGITDEQLQDFREVVDRVLRKLYKLTFTKE